MHTSLYDLSPILRMIAQIVRDGQDFLTNHQLLLHLNLDARLALISFALISKPLKLIYQVRMGV